MVRRLWPFLIVGLLAAAVVGASSRFQHARRASREGVGRAPRADAPRARAELVEGRPDVLRVPADVAEALGIRTSPVRRAQEARALVFTGSLALDANRLARVHPRFSGEVVEIGTADEDEAVGTPAGPRQLRFGDRVRGGQLLAVLWSTELGEKKSEYVDALSRLRMEQETMNRLEALLKDQAISERNFREAKREVESARIAVVRVERTLQSWRLTDKEIEAVKAEAEQMRTQPEARDKARERSWARLEVRAPFSGTIVEKNITVGDIVDTTTDLFMIADLGRLAAWAHVYEEDLPLLLGLPAPIPWTLQLKSDPGEGPLTGTIEEIGTIIDPNQHTALVMGHVDNASGRLRAGQFVVATIALPPDPDELEIPTSALVEDGDESVVFVQPDPGVPCYAMRHVTIVRHTGEVAYVRAASPAGSSPSSSQADDPSLAPGDRVVVSGALVLRAALRDLQAAARSAD